MAATIRCYCNDTITLARSDGGNLKVTPIFSPGAPYLLLEQEQAHQLHKEVGAMIAELWPPAEVTKPASLSIEDFEGDTIGVGLETRGGSLIVEADITEAGNEDGTYAVWLTEAQTEKLIASLEAHKKYVAQENARPKKVEPLLYDFGLSSTQLTGWPDLWEGRLFSGMVCGAVEAPTPKPEPEPKTYTITINLKE